jgi:hypothetical protein
MAVRSFGVSGSSPVGGDGGVLFARSLKASPFLSSPGTLCRFVIVFKLSPIGGGQGIETLVHPFQGPPDGACV